MAPVAIVPPVYVRVLLPGAALSVPPAHVVLAPELVVKNTPDGRVLVMLSDVASTSEAVLLMV